MAKQISFEDFDPNEMGHLKVWAVYSGGTRFKVYSSRGPALNGFMSWTSAKLYEAAGGRWIERAVKNGVRDCDNCHRPSKDLSYSTRDGQARWHKAWCWRRDGAAKITNPPELLCLCYDCKRDLGL